MRQAKITDETLFGRLTDVFRRKGYDGTSYADLMKATGLVKASLYHRFPGGKEEMVDAVLSNADRQFAEYVLAPAFERGEPDDRARVIARRLQEFYQSGKRWCLLDTLSLSDSVATLQHARESMNFWVDAFVRIGKDARLPPGVARKRAEEAIAAIEGGLVVARVMGNHRPFLRVLAELPGKLTGEKE